MEHNIVFYDEIKNELKTGDLILFHGMLLSSKINEYLTGSQWSHVGMVIRPEDIGINSSEGALPFIKRGQLIEGPLIDVSVQ